MNGTDCRSYRTRGRAVFTTAALPAPTAFVGVGLGVFFCVHHERRLAQALGVRSPSFVQDSPWIVVGHTNPVVLHRGVPESSHLAEKLSQSQIMRDYERAFAEATGLPLKFQAAGKKRPGMRGSQNANPFCVQMAETEPGCRMCVDVQERLSADSAGGATATAVCVAGLSDSTVPVRVGDKVLGYLQTGQVALRPLTRENFGRVAQWLKQGGVEADWKELEKTYLRTRVISGQQYDAVLRLLEVFSQHLSLAAEQIATQQTHAEPPMVERARRLIEERHGEDLSLDEVARTVNASTFHFCKMFKKATGMTFTEYLSMVRVAKAKKLLANPQARISEVAFEAGFASLTHFNRMFRRITGQSPTDFRQHLGRA